MTLWNRLFRTADSTPAPHTPNRLRVEHLEDRSVPAVLDLTIAGASGVLNDALFQQFNGRTVSHRQLDTFAELDGRGQRGHLGQVLETGRSNPSHAIKVKDLPTVTVNGVTYRELVLDVAQPRNSPLVSLDELKLYVSNSANQKGKFGSLTPVYDLDAGGDNWVKLTSKLNGSNTNGDMVVYIPDAALAGGKFLYVYSKFGVNESARCGEMTWSYGRCSAVGRPTPPPAPQTGSISGVVYQDENFNGIYDAGDLPVEAGRLVWIDTNGNGSLDAGEANTTTGADGSYTLAGLPANTPLQVRSIDNQGFATSPQFVTLDPDEVMTEMNIGFIPGAQG